jgi:hypothetical protein
LLVVGTPLAVVLGAGLAVVDDLVVVVLEGCDFWVAGAGFLEVEGLLLPEPLEGDEPELFFLDGDEGEVEVEGLLEWLGAVDLVVGVPDGVEVVGVLVVGVEVVDGVLCVLGVTGGVGVGAPHDSDIDLTGTERLREDSGAPWGSWKYNVWPVIRVTVTVQSAAEAAGSAAAPEKAAMMRAVTSATFSFPRLNTVAQSPPDISGTPAHPRHDRTAGA